MQTAADHARDYTSRLGWFIVSMPAGSKGPTGPGWNIPERALHDPATAQAYFDRNPTHNMGLLHGPSRTCALDVDNVEWTRIIFEGLGLDYDAILASAPRIIGRSDRGKVLFRAPDGLATHKISWPVQGDPRKTAVAFELRAGAVQDVLPPSIHPDTQLPYRWAGPSVFDGLPDMPGPLLRLWAEWDKFRPQLMEFCPWRETRQDFRPPSKPRPRGDRESVIEAFNAAHDIRELHLRYGYKPCGRDRFLSPNSSSGLAGVKVFDDGRAYSHHASDPFDSAHTYDAFEMWAYYEHGGDIQKAVKEAAQFLNVSIAPEHEYDPERIEHGRTVAAQIMGRKVDPSPLDDIPQHLLGVPGVLQEAVHFYNSTAPKEQPQFAVQAALAFASVVMGRRWQTDQANLSSLYFVNVGKSAAGKEHAKTTIERLLEAAELDRLIGPSGYTSAAGVMSALIQQPTHISIIDELGRVLQTSQAAGNHHKMDAQTILMEAFGRQAGTLRPQGYSKMALSKDQAKDLDRAVRYPALTILAMTTPSTLYDNLSSRYVTDGFLGRFLIVESHIGRQVGRFVRTMQPGEKLVAWAQECANVGNFGPGETFDLVPEPQLVPFEDECIPLLRECDAAMLKMMDEYERHGMEAMFGRTKEIAQRLALIVSRSKREDTISAESLSWAIDYATFYAKRTVAALLKTMADGPFEAACKAVFARIEAAGLRGVTEAELSASVKSFANLEPRRRKEVLEALAGDRGILCRNANEGQRGRPRFAWFAPE